MLKLKPQYFGHLMRRVDSLEKTLMLEKLRARGEGDSRGWDGWMASLTQWTWILANSGRWWWTGKPGTSQFMGSQRVRRGLATEQQQQCACCYSIFSFILEGSFLFFHIFYLLSFPFSIPLYVLIFWFSRTLPWPPHSWLVTILTFFSKTLCASFHHKT